MPDEDWIIELDQDESRLLKKIASCIEIVSSEDPIGFCNQVKKAVHFIPDRIKKLLYIFAETGSYRGFLLIKHIEMQNDFLPDTPANNTHRVGEKTEISKIQAILLSAIGNLIGYEAECGGNLFQDIVPNRLMEKNQTSLGSHIELEIHTEQAFSKLKPDILSLSCIRGDENAYTYILPIHAILDNTTLHEQETLRLPLWKTRVDLSFKIGGYDFIEGDIRGPLSILNGAAEGPTLTFDQDLMFGLNEDANKLIQKIIEIYHKNKICHKLQKGEIIFIDNRRALHGRSPFLPKYDGKDRFLVRCFAVLDYESTKYARKNGECVVSAIYS